MYVHIKITADLKKLEGPICAENGVRKKKSGPFGTKNLFYEISNCARKKRVHFNHIALLRQINDPTNKLNSSM